MLIGYARVSTTDQTTRLQLDALKEAGCAKIYRDEGVSGAATRRPGLDRALKALKEGDTLVVWRLDRLGRSLAHLVQTVAELGERGVAFRSLSDPIDTSNASGKLILHMMSALAEFERNLLIERTRAGVAAAKRAGVHFGPKFRLEPGKVEHARKLIEAGERPTAVARTLGISRATLYRAFARDA